MRSPALLPILAAVLAAAAGPAAGQTSDLRGVLFDPAVPTSIQLRELNPDGWRRVTIVASEKEGADQGGGLLGMMGSLLGGMFGGMADALVDLKQAPPAYTQGRTVTLGGETYLVVYQPPEQKGVDLMTLIRQGDNAKFPPPEKMTAETPLTMSLVNVRSIRTLANVRPFDLQRELEESAKAAEREAALREELNRRQNEGAGGLDLGGLDDPDLPPVTRPAPKPAPKKPVPKTAPKRPSTRKR